MIKKLLYLATLLSLTLATQSCTDNQEPPTSPNNTPYETQNQQNLPKKYTYTIVKATINIPAGIYYHSMFIVTSDMMNVRLKGYFQEVNKTDLYAYVFNNLNYQNWSAGANSKAIYTSGKVVVDQIDIPLTIPDTYYLVFSNLHSWFTSKNVDTNIELQYETW
jgi:hypothetical protein